MSELFVYNMIIVALCLGTIGAQIYSVRRFTMLLENIEGRMAYLQHDIQVRQIMGAPETKHAPATRNKAKKRQPVKKAAQNKPKTKPLGRPKKPRLNGANPQVLQ